MASGDASAPREQHWDDRRHFFAAAAEAMRRILVENARRKQRIKHGSRFQRGSAEDMDIAVDPPADELLAVHEALDDLTAVDPEAAELVKLHFFAGFTLDEAASLMGKSVRTAYRDWAFARASLARRLHHGG